jgi:hypothetical protein
MLKIIKVDEKKIQVEYGSETPYFDKEKIKEFIDGKRDYLESEYSGPMDYLDTTIERKKDGKIYMDSEIITIEELKQWSGLV